MRKASRLPVPSLFAPRGRKEGTTTSPLRHMAEEPKRMVGSRSDLLVGRKGEALTLGSSQREKAENVVSVIGGVREKMTQRRFLCLSGERIKIPNIYQNLINSGNVSGGKASTPAQSRDEQRAAEKNGIWK